MCSICLPDEGPELTNITTFVGQIKRGLNKYKQIKQIPVRLFHCLFSVEHEVGVDRIMVGDERNADIGGCVDLEKETFAETAEVYIVQGTERVAIGLTVLQHRGTMGFTIGAEAVEGAY